MRRKLVLLSAFALGLAAWSPVAHAAPRGAYEAALTTPLAAPRQEIVSGVLWKCTAERCGAAADGSRPVMVCQRVAKAFGRVARFTTPTGALSAEEISRCNGAS
jgi:hypothetical protein